MRDVTDSSSVDSAAERPSLRSGMGFAGASFATTVVLSFTSAIVISRLYGVDNVGGFALVSASWLLLVQVTNLSEHLALVLRLSTAPRRDPSASGLFYAILTFSMSVTTAAAAVIAVGSTMLFRGPLDEPDLVGPMLLLLVAYVLVENVSWNLDAVLSGFRAGRELFVARLTQIAVALAVSVALVPVSRSVLALVVGLVVSFVAGLAVRVRAARALLDWNRGRAHYRDGLRELPAVLRLGLRMVPGTIASGLGFQAGVWVLGAVGSTAAVGAYSRAAGLASRLQDAGFRIGEILFPALAERHRNGDDAGFDAVLAKTARLSVLLLVAVSTVGSAVAGPTLAVFGPGFAQGASAMAWLLVAYAAYVLTLLQAAALLAQQRAWASTSFVLVRVVVTAVVIYPFTARWGAAGAACALALPLLGEVVARTAFSGRAVRGLRDRSVLRAVLGAAPAGCAGYGVAAAAVAVLPPPAQLLGGALAGLAAYGAVVVVTGALPAAQLRQVTARVRAARG